MIELIKRQLTKDTSTKLEVPLNQKTSGEEWVPLTLTLRRIGIVGGTLQYQRTRLKGKD